MSKEKESESKSIRDSRVIKRLANKQEIPYFSDLDKAQRFIELEAEITPEREETSSRQGRQLVFAAKLANQPYDEAREFYLHNPYILGLTFSPHFRSRDLGKLLERLPKNARPDNFRELMKSIRKTLGADFEAEDPRKAEALRKLDLDIEVAEHFSQLGILQELKALEAEEIVQIERGEDVPAVNPKFIELIRQAKLSSNP